VNARRRERAAAEAVEEAQRSLPPEVREAAAAVAVHLAAAPAPEVLAEGFEPDLLGLFTGSPVGAPDDDPVPPQIHLYLDNLWDYADGREARFRAEVRLTYLHELGHYLGWDADEVAARGLE
jgi:predicted Zn-dependent protease with MMP-like domain